jgi:hypothetical protein
VVDPQSRPNGKEAWGDRYEQRHAEAGVAASLALIREGAERRHLVASAPAKAIASPTHAFYIAVMMGPVTNECNRLRVKGRGSAGNSCLRRSGPVQIPSGSSAGMSTAGV